MNILLCMNCANYFPAGRYECRASESRIDDYVHGGDGKFQYIAAQAMRTDSQACGPTARWFVPIPEEAA